jgi:hypothetical protein
VALNDIQEDLGYPYRRFIHILREHPGLVKKSGLANPWVVQTGRGADSRRPASFWHLFTDLQNAALYAANELDIMDPASTGWMACLDAFEDVAKGSSYR